MSDKLKWSYNKKHKEWWTLESAPWANDGFSIKRVSRSYQSRKYATNYTLLISAREFSFNRLMNAKKFAELYRYG